MTTEKSIDEKIIVLISELKCVLRNRGIPITEKVSTVVDDLVIVALAETIEVINAN